MKILVVEDEKEIRDFLIKNLEEACFAVDSAEDGETGLYMARINSYDVIVLDNILPKKTGADVCKELRSMDIAVPIIILSVRSEVLTKIDLLNYGADDYLTKPFSFEELLARIRALMRRPSHMDATSLQIKDLFLDEKRQLVTRAGKKIALTRKEFMLLEYLMRNKGLVLSRGMIMEHVWDMNADPFSNTIETHVMSLRKKIGDKDNNLIITVPGRGYKIKDE